MDRLTSIDASFLTNESPTSHMHIGGVTIFEGPPPSYEDLLDHVESRLHLVPRYRQKLADPAGRDRPPVLGRRPAVQPRLPRPPFRAAGARRRERAAPDGRPGLLPAARPDQAALGAVAGRGPAQAPLRADLEDPPRPRRRRRRRRHRHRALRRQAGPRARQARSRVDPEPEPVRRRRSPPTASRASRRRRSARPPGRLGGQHRRGAAARQIQEAAEGVGEVAWEFANPAPDLPLNVPIGPHRRYTWVRGDLADFKRIKTELGGTVNDVVLCAVAGALRRWLHDARRPHRGARAARPGSGLDPGDRSARPARQPDRRRARPAARLRRGPGRPAAHGSRGDGRGQVVEEGARRRGDLAIQRLRAADAARPGGADQLLDPPVQPDRHQRPGPADPALRARPRAPRHLPGRLPAREPRAGDRDHVLQRQDRLRPARRLRLDGGRAA